MRIIIFSLTLLTATVLVAQKKALNYYLPDNISYNKDIPTPQDYLGYQVGEWHVTHDQLVGYMNLLAEKSNRITIETYARSYENRPLVLLTITSPQNHNEIESIQKNHQKLSTSDAGSKLDIDKMPVIIYQGYSVHGNEASGANATLLYAYYLAAATGPDIDKKLSNAVILLDPCFNPDGLHRFSSWVNSHKSFTPSPNTENRELNEVWPGGRTNHYWFDLNRDWLLLAHPESRGRIQNFQKWKPNILTDHHEMGSNSTYFFQPGIPTRTNPMTPKKNQELTRKVGTYHAKALDKIGSLYYAEESFDDFYYGKGSTYPDAQACIGILFEQASSRGHLHESTHGDLTFPFTVRNQLTTSFSTLEAGINMRKELLAFQQDFYKTSISAADKDLTKAFIFSAKKDDSSLKHFVELLLQHNIKVYNNPNNTKAEGKSFIKNKSYIVPTKQAQYRLIKGIFEKQTEFKDSLFYDVSSWTLPLAFNLNYAKQSKLSGKPGKLITINDLNQPKTSVTQSDYAYLFRWNDYYTPKVIYQLLNQGLLVKVANQPFEIETKNGKQYFDPGTIMVPAQNQPLNPEAIFKLIQKLSEASSVQFHSVISGFTPSGIDLGSPSFSKVKMPKIMMIVGEGVTSYDAGEVWHLLDQRYQIPITIVDMIDFRNADLDRYNTVVMVNGNYRMLGSQSEKIKTWVKDGGTLITMRNAVSWAKGQGMANINFKSSSKPKKQNNPRRPYNKLSADRGAQVIGGAIYNINLDLTHPLCYGFYDDQLAVFRKGTSFMQLPKNKYAAPGIYTSKPLISGYSAKQQIEKAKNAAAIINCSFGKGRVICLSDNPNFRAFWYGTNKLFANAIFFGPTIKRNALENPAPKK